MTDRLRGSLQEVFLFISITTDILNTQIYNFCGILHRLNYRDIIVEIDP